MRGAWRLRAPVREARHARLDETPGDTLGTARDGAEWVVPVAVGPRGVHTVLVR